MGAGVVFEVRNVMASARRLVDAVRVRFSAGQVKSQGYAASASLAALAAEKTPLTPPFRLPLSGPCPRCGARWAYHEVSGERVRARALRVSEEGCSCGACHSFWGADRFEWPARLLGCPSLPT
jgi:hypothetical protein